MPGNPERMAQLLQGQRDEGRGWTQDQRNEWSSVLRAAIKKRGKGKRGAQVHLAALVGIDEGHISRLATGKHLALPHLAERLSEALDTPRIFNLNIEIRTKPCIACGTEFVDGASGIRKWCEYRGACYLNNRAKLLEERGIRGQTLTKNTVVSLRSRLKKRDVAIAAECLSCEPDGICRNAKFHDGTDCHFLGVTPFIRLPLLTDDKGILAPDVPDGRNQGRGEAGGGHFTLIEHGPNARHRTRTKLT